MLISLFCFAERIFKSNSIDKYGGFNIVHMVEQKFSLCKTISNFVLIVNICFSVACENSRYFAASQASFNDDMRQESAFLYRFRINISF